MSDSKSEEPEKYDFFAINSFDYKEFDYKVPEYSAILHTLDSIICIETNGNTLLLITILLISVLFTWLRIYWLLLIVFYYANQYMQASIKRIKRKVYMKAKKDLALKNLDTDAEQVEWLNQFLRRYWINYEPGLSDSIKQTVDLSLEMYKPSSLTELRLTEFTLGSEAPRINGIKTYPRDDETLTMDMDISFTPVDVEMLGTKEALLKDSRNTQIELLAKVAVVPLPIYVSIKDFSLIGTMRVGMKFMSDYPFINIVHIAFMEKPEVDFELKPLKAMDINKFGDLGGSIKGIVQDQIAALMVNPIKMSFPIGEWMGASFGALEKPVGVLRVSLYQAKGLRNVDITSLSDPCASVFIGNVSVAKTRTLMNNLDPKWYETFEIIVYKNTFTDIINNSDQLQIKVFHGESKHLGSTNGLSLTKWIKLLGMNDSVDTTDDTPIDDDELEDLLVKWGSPLNDHQGHWQKLIHEKKSAGSIQINLAYFPILEVEETEKPDDTVAELVNPTGILTLFIHQAKELAVGESGDVTVDVFDNSTGRLIFESPHRKHTGNPNWECRHDRFCQNIALAEYRLVVKNRGRAIGECKVGMAKALTGEEDWYKIHGRGNAKIRISAQFKPVDIFQTKSNPAKAKRLDPMGLFRINVCEAKELDNKEILSKSDPYCKIHLNNRLVGITNVQSSTLNPHWNETFYAVGYSMKETLYFEVYDENQMSKDEEMGKVYIILGPLFEYFKKDRNIQEMNKLGKLELDGLEVSVVDKDTLSVWAPLYLKEEKIHDKDAEDAEIAAAVTEDSKKTKFALKDIAKSSSKFLRKSGTTLLKEINANKVTQKGFIRFEITLFKVLKDKMIPTVHIPERIIPDANANRLTEKEKPEPTTDKVENLVPAVLPIERSVTDIITKFSSGILNVRVARGEFERKLRVYLDIFVGSERMFSTGTSHEAANTCQWYASSDHFVADIRSAKFSAYLREQRNDNRDPGDPVLGYFETSTLHEFLGRGELWISLKKYIGSTNSTNYLNLPDIGRAEFSFAFSPVVLDVELKGSEDMGILHLDILSATDLPPVDKNGKSDPYIVVSLNGKEMHKTKIHKKTLNPVFDEGLLMDITSRLRSTVFLEIMDWDQFGKDDIIGRVPLRLAGIKPEEVVKVEIPIPNTEKGILKLSYMFEPKTLDTNFTPEIVMSNYDGKEATEVAGIGKFGRGLTSQVTGLLKKDGKKEKGVRTSVVSKLTEANVIEAVETTEVPDRVNALANRNRSRGGLNTLGSELKLNEDTRSDSPDLKVAASLPVPSTEHVQLTDVTQNSKNEGNSDQSLNMPETTMKRTVSGGSIASAFSLLEGDDKKVIIKILAAKGLKAVDAGGTSDPYVKTYINGKSGSIHKTSTVKKNLNPSWTDETFRISVTNSTLTFKVLDFNLMNKDVELGSVKIELSKLFETDVSFDRWFDLSDGEGSIQISGQIKDKSDKRDKKEGFWKNKGSK